MDVSGGNVTITKSKAWKNGGSGEVGPPPRSGTQSVMAMQFGAEGSLSSRLERFAVRCSPCCNAASHISKNQGLPCPSQLSYSIVVKGYICQNGGRQAFAEMLVSRADSGLSAKYGVSLRIQDSLHIITGFLAWTADTLRSCR